MLLVAGARQHPRSRARGLVRARARQGEPRLHGVGAGQHRGQGLSAPVARVRAVVRGEVRHRAQRADLRQRQAGGALGGDRAAHRRRDAGGADRGSAGAAGDAQGRARRAAERGALRRAVRDRRSTTIYERRLWDEIASFQSYSTGAHVVGALVLAAARTGEFVTTDEAKKLDDFHDQQAQWMSKYLMGPTCDAECKGKILEVMLSHYDESQGDYDARGQARCSRARTRSRAAPCRGCTRGFVVPGRSDRLRAAARSRAGARGASSSSAGPSRIRRSWTTSWA